MSRNKYYYNTHTLQFEQLQVPLRTRLWRVFGILCAVMVAGGGIYLALEALLPMSQKEMALQRELEQMTYQYETLTDQLGRMSEELLVVQNRDAEVHRFVFNMDPIDPAIWSAGIGGHDQYAKLSQYPNAGEILTETQRMADKLERQLEIQSGSLDLLEKKARERGEKLECIPSIKPVRIDLLKRDVTLLSGYGIRLHPVHKVKKLHQGIDFTAPVGTAIQATGAGVISAVRRSRTGYGHHVVINHGFGFETLYAHMSEIDVEVGEKVTKGQKIGTVGSTGTSTAPHCHYEVREHGKAVDPIQYCLDGLTAEEYRIVVQRAALANQSFD